MARQGSFKPPHYAWVVLGLCFVTLLAAQGVRFSFGAFVTPWEDDFGVSRGAVTSISFVSFLLYGLTQPLVGRLADAWGAKRLLLVGVLLVGISILLTFLAQNAWQLMALYGVLATLGFSATSPVVASVAITRWFQAKRGLAFGLIEAGAATGQLVLVPGSLLLIEWLGWRQTSLLLGLGLCLVVLPLLALFLSSSPSAKGLEAFGDKPKSDRVGEEAQPLTLASPTRPAWRTRDFWFLLLPFFICGATTTGLMDTHLIPYAHDHGFTSVTTSLAVTVLAAFNIFGTLVSGVLADRWDNARILGFLYLGRAASLVVLVFARDPLTLVSFAALFGLVDFATLAPTQLLATKRFRGGIGTIFGYLFMSHQLGSAVGSFVPGLIYDLTGGYLASLSGAMTLLLVASVLSFALSLRPPSTLKPVPQAV